MIASGTVWGVPFDSTPNSVTIGDDSVAQPGSAGERALQRRLGTETRAAKFYADQMCDRLLPTMIEFVGRMEMMFLSTSDASGECDSSLRAGPLGFLQVLDDRHLAYPEYRGNGVHASLANITENPHVGLLMVDFERDMIGLHVNGRARILGDDALRFLHPDLPVDESRGRRAERWVVVEVVEAYIHCRKHIPRMARVHEKRDWGTDDPARKGGDYFGAKVEPVRRPYPDPEASPPTLPIPAQRQYVDPESSRHRFPSTTHLLTGTATARPLRPSPSSQARPRRIRWLSS